ncbi:MAG: DUF1918 domain-containing protein [Gaiellaceae bacterium]
MSGRAGRILVERRFVGGRERRGEIVEILGEPPRIRYRVRWEDGRESIVYPGSDATIKTAKKPATQHVARKHGNVPAIAAEGTTRAKADAPKPALRASAGDRLVIRAHYLGEPPREAEILAVLGEQGGPPYRVRWEDNSHESVVFPGPDAFVERFEHAPKRRHKAPR